VSLEVSLGKSRFRNPLVLASGTFGYGLTYTHVIDPGACWQSAAAYLGYGRNGHQLGGA
jgi:hypothetical protein